MDNIIVLIVGLVIIGISYLIYQKLNELNKPKEDKSQQLMLDLIENLRREVRETTQSSRMEMQQSMQKINENLRVNMTESSQTIQNQFKQSAGIIQEVTEKLTKLDETNKQVMGFAEQIKSLENILKNPKQRGILGEYFLETLLANVLQPNQYQIQYPFKSGEIVDAAIFFKDKIIPIDAKFSLEKYNRIMEEHDEKRRTVLEKEFKADIKTRIDETSKYIRQSEGTTDFAFMFIPAEGIYYNLLIYKTGTVEINTNDLIEYAFKKHVIIVSPTSFYAYLETVLQGLKALEMEASVKDVIKRVEELGRHLGSYQTYMQKLGNNLGTTVNMYNSASKEFQKIDKDVVKITGPQFSINVDLEQLEKPLQD